MIGKIRLFDLRAPNGSASAKVDLEILRGDHVLPTRLYLVYSGSIRKNDNESESWRNRKFMVGTNPGISIHREEIEKIVCSICDQFNQRDVNSDEIQAAIVDLIRTSLVLDEKTTPYTFFKDSDQE